MVGGGERLAPSERDDVAYFTSLQERKRQDDIDIIFTARRP